MSGYPAACGGEHHSGDLLACRFNGNLHYVGKFALYRGDSNRTHLYPDKLIRFRVDTHKVLPEFVCIAMNASKQREAIGAFCATTAGNIGISASNLNSISLPVPTIDEQRRTIAHLHELQSKLDSLKRLQLQTAAELNALLPSILDKAFKGGL
jgi:type I restriction enzyme S subunit